MTVIQFPRFVKWFNSLERGKIPTPSQAELILHISYSTLVDYYSLLSSIGCIRQEGKTRGKKYFKLKNYDLETQ